MDDLYILARRVLLDALSALGAHRDAAVLVGAQAVYLRVGEAVDLAVAPSTTDGDLAIDPSILGEVPPLERALAAAGFFPKPGAVGVWLSKRPTAENPERDVAIDLLVPYAVSPGKGRRDASLPGHAARTARIVDGLEGALVDADLLRVAAFEPSDLRSFELRVAGPAGLLVAKVHKIRDRSGTDRQSDKDALDVLRILRGIETAELTRRYRTILNDPISASAAGVGLELFEAQFSTIRSIGVEMAVRSAGALANPAEIAASAEALAGDLLRALR